MLCNVQSLCLIHQKVPLNKLVTILKNGINFIEHMQTFRILRNKPSWHCMAKQEKFGRSWIGDDTGKGLIKNDIIWYDDSLLHDRLINEVTGDAFRDANMQALTTAENATVSDFCEFVCFALIWLFIQVTATWLKRTLWQHQHEFHGCCHQMQFPTSWYLQLCAWMIYFFFQKSYMTLSRCLHQIEVKKSCIPVLEEVVLGFSSVSKAAVCPEVFGMSTCLCKWH